MKFALSGFLLGLATVTSIHAMAGYGDTAQVKITVSNGTEKFSDQFKMGAFITDDISDKGVHLVRNGLEILLVADNDSSAIFKIGDLQNRPLKEQCSYSTSGPDYLECNLSFDLPAEASYVFEAVDPTYSAHSLTTNSHGFPMVASKGAWTEKLTLPMGSKQIVLTEKSPAVINGYNSLDEVAADAKKQSYSYANGQRTPLK